MLRKHIEHIENGVVASLATDVPQALTVFSARMNAFHPNRDDSNVDGGLTSSCTTGTKNRDDRGCDNMTASDHQSGSNSAGKGNLAFFRAAHWVSLAAAPTFIVMALLVRVSSEKSALSGMVLMYVLMAAFESVHWLKLMSGRRSDAKKN
jgi:hypothetical protein